MQHTLYEGSLPLNGGAMQSVGHSVAEEAEPSCTDAPIILQTPISWRPDEELQRVSRKTLDAFINTCGAEGHLRLPARLYKGDLFPTLPACASHTHGGRTKREAILTA